MPERNVTAASRLPVLLFLALDGLDDSRRIFMDWLNSFFVVMMLRGDDRRASDPEAVGKFATGLFCGMLLSRFHAVNKCHHL